MKQYILALASSALLLGLAGCKKQLEEVKPETTLDPSQVLADPSSAFALYNGVYNTFRGYQGTFFVMGEMRSETWEEEPHLRTIKTYAGRDYVFTVFI